MPHNAPVGIVANPYSARDIRRLVAHASALQVSDRANIVLRVLAGLGAAGVDEVLMMPDKGGIRALLRRELQRLPQHSTASWPRVRYLDMPVAGTVDDTLSAVETMGTEGVRALIVLGGDGTHRAVASRCGDIPIAGLSTGTNNAFPEFREPTVVGLATGLVARGAVSLASACRPNKALRVVDASGREDLSLVDVCVTSERFVGARALWRPSTFRELFVTFAEPGSIGMSAIAALLTTVRRDAPHGLRVLLGPPEQCTTLVQAPIAPGLVAEVGIVEHAPLPAASPEPIRTRSGAVALDGEREIEIHGSSTLSVTLEIDAVRTIDSERVMTQAAREGLLTRSTVPEAGRIKSGGAGKT